MLRLMLALPLLTSCRITTDDPALVALSTSTGDHDDLTGSTAPPVMTSTDAGSTSTGESTGDSSTSSGGVDDSSSTSSSTGDAGDSTSTTGAVLPDCRDGDPEATCKVFVSSAMTPPDILVEGFNALCSSLACSVPGEACVEYRAVIRSSNDFWAPFAGFTGTYTLLDGSVVAESGDLHSALPITLTETGDVVPNKALVWTGYESLFWTCAQVPTPWATAEASTYTQVGHAGGYGESKWGAEQVTCDILARVYCAEVPR